MLSINSESNTIVKKDYVKVLLKGSSFEVCLSLGIENFYNNAKG